MEDCRIAAMRQEMASLLGRLLHLQITLSCVLHPPFKLAVQ
jgi:hypothetical protein